MVIIGAKERAGEAAAVAVIALVMLASANTQPNETCLASTDDVEHVRAVMLDGLDKALKEYTAHLFDVMVKDPVDQPARAIAGMRPAIVAYAKGRNAALNWNAPICGEQK